MAQLKSSMTEAVIVGPMSNYTGSTFFMPDDNSTYDSDATERFTDKLPNEDLGRMMWACEKNCCERALYRGRFPLHDSFTCLSCLSSFLSLSSHLTSIPT